jgi:tetratricopeptide (TPR) repeat protein
LAEAGSKSVSGAQAVAGAGSRHAWKQAWPIPALLIGGVALTAAMWATLGTTPPEDVGSRLVASAAMIDAAQYGEALELLNTGVLPLVGGEAMTPDQVREFFVQRARALYMGQKDAGISREENHRAIVNEYREAETRGAVLTPRDSAFLAWTLLDLGEIDGAYARAAALPESMKAQRIELTQAAIEASSQGPHANTMRALELLTDLGSEIDATDELRLWVLARHSSLLARQGFADEAITRILRTLPRLEDSDPTAVGEVYATLGEAYVVSNEGAEAGRALSRADQLLPREHPRRGLVALLQGELAAEEGDTTRARERYVAVLERAEPGDRSIRALLGLAEVENQAAMDQGVSGAPEESISRYEQLIDLLTGVKRGGAAGASGQTREDASPGHETEAPEHGEPAADGAVPADGHGAVAPDAQGASAHGEAPKADHGKPAPEEHGKPAAHGASAHGGAPGERFTPPDAATIDRVTRSLLARHGEQFEAGNFETALRFAMLAERLHSPESMPRELVMAVASARLELAGEMLRSASGDGSVLSLAAADPATQREAKGHLLAAGDAFRLYASKVAQADIREYADALWNAADCFDRAGDLEASIAAFEQFATDMATDVRRPEAIFRLAQAQQARGEIDLATRLYRELIADRATGDQGGEFADASFVPLARALFMDADAANDAEGESLLQRVVSGELGGPGSTFFRDALFELGSVFYRTGRYARAIERFEEFTKLSGGTEPRVTDARYMLAESHRLSAAEIATELRAAMPEALRRQREGVRGSRLRLATALYDDVRRELEEMPRRTALQELRLRNCFLYAADCAYDAGDFESAIRRYEAARERYPRDPSSLVAMTQVVSALLAQGDRERAVLANARAKRFYQSLPESAWDDPSLPMTRAAWERWLDAQDRLAQTPLAQETGGTE